MSMAASFYGSRTGRPNTSTLSDARSSEYHSEDLHPANGGSTLPIDIRNFIRHQQELIPEVMEEIKTSIGEPLKSLQGQVTRLQEELSKMKEEKCEQQSFNNKKTRLPKVLTAAVKRLHESAENHFEASKLYGDSHNVEVANFLKVQLMEQYNSEFTEAVIKRVVYRHFESRRMIYLDNQPSRLVAKEANMKKNKVRNRQRLIYCRRMKLCKDKEKKFWGQINEKYVTEVDSDASDPEVLVQFKPKWRSERLEKFIKILNTREAKTPRHKKKKRVVSDELSTSGIPVGAPQWAVARAYQDQSGSQASPERTQQSYEDEHGYTTEFSVGTPTAADHQNAPFRRQLFDGTPRSVDDQDGSPSSSQLTEMPIVNRHQSEMARRGRELAEWTPTANGHQDRRSELVGRTPTQAEARGRSELVEQTPTARDHRRRRRPSPLAAVSVSHHNVTFPATRTPAVNRVTPRRNLADVVSNIIDQTSSSGRYGLVTAENGPPVQSSDSSDNEEFSL